jgi:ribosomal protein S14
VSNRVNQAPDRWFRQPTPRTVPCARCGHRRRFNESRPLQALCRDCLDVAADLGELELWIGVAA